MSIETKLYDTLSGSAALVAVVGSAIYPETRQQSDALPAVVYSRTGGLRVNSLDGYAQLENANIEVNVYAASIDTRRSVGELVISAMVDATAFNCILEESPSDFYDDEVGTYERTMTFSVWNRE